MGELVNLNRYRKRQKRQADGAAAAENRVRHGTRRAERRREATKREREAACLDGKKRDTPAAEDGRDSDEQGDAG
ncbi:MAG: DUF4169 family protein [Alphaproteobacteria bacterium]